MTDSKLVLRSVKCRDVAATDALACEHCAALGKLDTLLNILDRACHGPHENVSYRYYTVENLLDALRQKTTQINDLKLARLNLQRSLHLRARNLEAFKRFLFAVAKGDVPRLHSLVTMMINNGASIFAIVNKIAMANDQLYSAKGYTDADYKQQFLFHKLGGRAVAELAHRTHGLPSMEATRRYMRTLPLLPSTKMPTIEEMSLNLDVSYPPNSASEDETPRLTVGFQLMVDEIKIESRLRWDARTNKIVGVCREHSANLSMDFESIHEPDAIIESILAEEDPCHFATEVRVNILCII